MPEPISVAREKAKIHAHDARRDADQVPDDGQQARNENPDGAIVVGPGFCPGDLFRRDQHIAAIAHHQRSSDQPGRPVHDRGAAP